MRHRFSSGIGAALWMSIAAAAVLAFASIPAFGGNGQSNGQGKGNQPRIEPSMAVDCGGECLVGQPIRISGGGFDPSKDVVRLDVGGTGVVVAVSGDGTIAFDWSGFDQAGSYDVLAYQQKNRKHSQLIASTSVTIVASDPEPEPPSDPEPEPPSDPEPEPPSDPEPEPPSDPEPEPPSDPEPEPPSDPEPEPPSDPEPEPPSDPEPQPGDGEQPAADVVLDSSGGRFRVTCDLSHQAQVDPIVVPFQASHHMHDFFGNTLTTADPDYSRMLNGGTTCGFSGDTAAYWFPSLQAPDGSFVQPEQFRFYYRARPVDYEFGTNYFPADFKMIAGGVGAPDTAAYWTCDGESDTKYTYRKTYIPDCTGVEDERLVAHVFFPSCWDGVNLDSADHRSHVAYGLDDGEVVSTSPETCPASHPYKIPQLDLRVVYPIADGTGHMLADGEQIPHADFWNTWQQSALEGLIDDCLRSGINCGSISD